MITVRMKSVLHLLHSLNIKGNRVHLEEKITQPGAQITTIFKLS